jgi:carbonic anhydrase
METALRGTNGLGYTASGVGLPALPPPPPAKRLAVVTCMDARVNVERILGLAAGDAHVSRNAGALVTDDVRRSLEISRTLGTEEVVLLLHTDCAGRSGDLDAAARDAAAQLGGSVRGMVYDVDTDSLREVA